MQVKLLRAIQEKRVRKVGETQEDPVDVRIISATHQNLAALVAGGRFRQDLFYRLNVIELRMPPLRECRDDIAGIAAAFWSGSRARTALPAARLDDAALQALAGYDFPGNVRELENILERALALSGRELISAEDLQLGPGREEREPARRRRRRVAAAVPGRGRAQDHPRGARQDRLQPHRRGQAPRHQLPPAALQNAAARHHR
jgi:two-component system response regulator PilR (NtrC family)